MVGREDAAESRDHDLARCRRDHEEREAAVRKTLLQEPHQRGDGALEPHTPPRLEQVLKSHPAELGIVSDEVRQLSTLLDEVGARQSGDALLVALHPEQLAQHEPRVVEAEGLIEIRGQHIVSALGVRHVQLHPSLLVAESEWHLTRAVAALKILFFIAARGFLASCWKSVARTG